MKLQEILLTVDNPQVEPLTMVDPPSGWQHGFPAPLRKNYPLQLLVAGYRENEIEMCLKHSRMWSVK